MSLGMLTEQEFNHPHSVSVCRKIKNFKRQQRKGVYKMNVRKDIEKILAEPEAMIIPTVNNEK